MNARLIVIQGAPASGKTTLYRKLQNELPDVIFLSKDSIKEFLFDTQPKGDRQWSRILGKVSITVLYTMAEEFLRSGRNVVIESAFYTEYAQEDIKKLNASTLELYCSCNENLRLARFKERAQTTRHPGHSDTETISEVLPLYQPINIGEVEYIDTTVGIDNSFFDILERVKDFLGSKQSQETL